MKKVYLLLLVLFTFSGFSQKDYTRYYNSWRLGLNAGAAWQTADMRSCWGGAGGFTLEKGLGENATNFFSFAIRGRYLAANTYGMDYVRNYNFKDNDAYNGKYDLAVNYTDTAKYKLGYVYDNYKMKLGEGSLELQLTFNRLRQQTGVILNLWGGVGVTSFRTKTDLTDGSGILYDFSKVDSTGSKSKAITNYNALIDKNYESYAYGSRNGDLITFSPSAGVGLGYQFTPGFSMLFEYKITLPQGTSADLLDGKFSPNSDAIGGSNDYYHYAGLNLLFTLRGKKKTKTKDETVYTNTVVPTTSVVTTNTSVTTTSIVTNPTTEQKPIISYINPPVSGQITNNAQYKVTAQILNISSASQIQFKFNYANYSNFTYNAQTHVLEYFATLKQGNNLVQIIATNSAGSDSKSTTIIYEIPKPAGDPPSITITSPSSCPYNTQVSQYNFVAYLSNVIANGVVTVKVNNVATSNYSFNQYSGQLNLPLTLVNGANNVSVSVTNKLGSDSKSCLINYTPQTQQTLPPPVITFITPSMTGQVSTNATYDVKAQVLNIADQSGASVYLNGMSVPFTYNAATKQVTFTASLINGSNPITIYANNTAGDDTKSTEIIYNVQATATGLPPQVNLVAPATANSNTSFGTYNFKLSVQNVASKADINVVFNGIVNNTFIYNPTTKIVSLNTGLQNGVNTLVVKGTNPYGVDSKTINVTYANKVVAKNPPLVTILTPVTASMTVNNSNYTFNSTVTNVPNASGLVVKLNGNVVTAFNYDGSNLSYPATLIGGANYFEVTGSNVDGTDKKTTMIIYRQTTTTIPPPVVTLINPVSVQNFATAIIYPTKFKVINVASKNDITILFNGVNQTNFTYDLGTKIVDFTANLNVGTNTISVTGTNSVGNDSKQIYVAYREPKVVKMPPTVVITNPASSPANSAAPNYIFKATVNNVPTVSGLVVKFNGGVVANFSYDGHNLTFPVNLPQGNNSFEVTATNNDGSDQKSAIVKFTPRIITPKDTSETGVPTVTTTTNPGDQKITICHIPPGNNQNPQTIEIPVSAWAAHQAHGDYMGSCQTPTTTPVEEKITICHIPPGNNQNPQTIEIPVSAWAAHQAHGDYMGSCQTPTVAPVEEKITICHIPPGNNQNPQTIEISVSAWAAHQAHGDYMGSCQTPTTVSTPTTTPVEEEKIMICHIPPGNNQNPQTIEIPVSAWAAHQAHGDYMGSCQTPTVAPVEEKITICHIPPGNNNQNPQTIEIPVSAWAAHQAHGDYMGSCQTPTTVSTPTTTPVEEEKITICHIPPGNRQNPQTITIPMSAWTAHQAHGDYMGTCLVNTTTVTTTTTTSTTTSTTTTTTTTTTPSNTDKKITICHIPPGNNQNPQTITISENAWPAHQAHGDTMGSCPANRNSNQINVEPKKEEKAPERGNNKGIQPADTVKKVISNPNNVPRRPR